VSYAECYNLHLDLCCMLTLITPHGCFVLLSLKFIFWMYSWVWLLNVHLAGLALPELKIKQADCPIDERTYWYVLFQK
jgi:hypothetical protein